MKAIKAMGTIDEDGQLTLDNPITTEKNSRVEVIVLIREEVEIDDYEQRVVENRDEEG